MKKYLIAFFFTSSIVFAYLAWPSEPERHLPETLKLSNDLMYSGQYDSAIYYAKTVIDNAENYNNIAYAQAITGYSWYIKGSLDSSYNHYTKALKATNQADSTDYYLQISTLNMLGLIFKEFEMHRKAVDYFKRALTILKKHERPAITNVYYNLSYNQSKLNDIECVKSYYKTLEYATKYEDSMYETLCMHDLGILMLETDNYESASEYFNMALETEYTKSNSLRQSFAYQGLGEVNFFLGNLEQSEKFLKEALSLKKELDNKKYFFSSYLYLARLFEKKGSFSQAEDYFITATEYFSLTNHTRENIAVFKELSKLQFKLGKIEESNKNNTRHYAEIDIYLDEREKAIQLAEQDQFEITVAASEAQFRDKSKLQMLKDEMDWEVAIKVGSILSFLGLIYLAKRKITRLRTSLDINMQSIQKLRTYP